MLVSSFVSSARDRASSLSRSCVRRFSTHKDLKFGNDGRGAIAKGIEILAKAVSITLGPKGRNVLIEQPYGSPKITKDGVTVAKSIVLKDKFENIGAKIVQEVANKTNEVAGDGTTTSTVLTREIFMEGMKIVAQGLSLTEFRRGVQLAVDEVVKVLQENKRDITTSQEITQVATISANGDDHVGKLISEAMGSVGKEGVITVQEGKTVEDEIEVTEGLKYDRGFISPYFMTDPRSQKAELEKPLILIAERKISTIQDLLPSLDIAAKSRRPLLIVTEDLDGEALAISILNKIRGQIQICAIKAPGFGDNRKAILRDIAISTGAHVFDDVDIKLDNCKEEHLGTAASVTVTKDDTIFINGGGKKAQINEYIEQVRASLESTKSEYEKDKIRERYAKLASGIAVIKVGGSSEVEVGEKKDRFVDALNATRAAVEEGIVPGGGVALLKASKHLESLKITNYDQKIGVEAVRRAILSPCRTIVDNSGAEGAVVVGELLKSYDPKKASTSPAGSPSNFNYGYDASNDTYVDMIAAGIVDPLKVVRTALVDASGVASLLTTSECVIVDSPKTETTSAPMPGMGAGGIPGLM